MILCANENMTHTDTISCSQKLDKLQSLTSNAKFDDGDVRAVTAAIEFIATTAAKYNTDGETVSNELQQLGLPRGTIFLLHLSS
jgi:hypothetical protein